MSLENTVGIYTNKMSNVECPHCGAELDVGDCDVFERITCPACEKELAVPARLGDFMLLDELGRGGMGAVYLARDEALDRLVAIKVIRAEFGRNQELYDNLVLEAQATATLNHRHVVQIYSFGRQDGQPYFVMELVDADRFDLMMKREEHMDERQLLKIALEISAGLRAAHEAGLTHGDIKPANILFSKRGVAKVVDFGLARFGEAKGTREIWGTPYYIAPEKAKGKVFNSSSDQYSLGATLWHALAGRPPFDGETANDVVINSLKQPTPSLKEARPDISDQTAYVVERMMSKTPTRRYPTYASMEADLQEALAQAETNFEESMANAAQADDKKSKMPAPLRNLLSALALGIVVAGGYFIFKTSKAKPPPAPPLIHLGGNDNTSSGWTRTLATPFRDREIKLISAAIAEYQAGGEFGAASRLTNVHKKFNKGDPAHAWLDLIQGQMYALNQQHDVAADLWSQVISMDLKLDSKPIPHDQDPRLLARFLKNVISEQDFTALLKTAPAWYQRMGQLCIGISLKHSGGQKKSAQAAFKKYLQAQLPEAQQWTGMLAPMVSRVTGIALPGEAGAE